MVTFRNGLGLLQLVGSIALTLTGCEGTDSEVTGQGGTPNIGGGTSDPNSSIGGAITSNGGSSSRTSGNVGGTGSLGLGGRTTSGGSTSAGSTSIGGSTSSAGGSTTSKGGGTSSTGGTTAKGGTSSTGGTTAKGGTSSTGGTTAKGGTSSTGGTTSRGGTTSTGGTTSRGGTSSTGGTTAKGGTTGTAGSTSSGTCKFPSAHNGNGSVTWYQLSQGTATVNCSYPTHPSSETVDYVVNNGQYFAAMNTSEYATAAACGACVQVTRDGGTSITVMIADQCPVGSNPKCKAGHIDLAKPAFLQLGTESEGYLGTGNGGVAGSISWKYVVCPVTGNVKVHLKEPSNTGWNEFLVANHRTPVSKFEAQINGSWVTGTRKEYNYFNVGSTVSFPLSVRLTDINGAVITGTVQAGTAVQDLGSQFPTCN
ncbi:MAG: expansin EXLX1 family cellulose-binding protein [Polyangiaceae bacterium]